MTADLNQIIIISKFTSLKYWKCYLNALLVLNKVIFASLWPYNFFFRKIALHFTHMWKTLTWSYHSWRREVWACISYYTHVVLLSGRIVPMPYHVVHMSSCHIMSSMCHHDIFVHMSPWHYAVHVSPWHMLSMCHIMLSMCHHIMLSMCQHDIYCPYVTMTLCCPCLIMTYAAYVWSWHAVYMWSWHHVVHVSSWHIMLYMCHDIKCCPCVTMTYVVHVSSWHMLSMCHHDICCPCVIMTYVVLITCHISLMQYVVHVLSWHILS